jgi:ATP-dependent DNA helicase RecG
MDSAALTTLLHALVVTEQPARLVFENEGGFYEGQPLDYLEGHKIPRRYFPMPDYDLSDAGAVKLAIHGGVVDPAYSRLLIQKTDLPLADVLALDRVQKKLPIPDEAAARLRRAGLIEGRKPEYHVSAQVAAATDQKADYIRTRAQDDEFYAKLLTDYLQRYGGATRSEINRLLLPKLSEALSAEQKNNKIANLLTRLRRTNRIQNSGTRARPVWRLVP